MKSTTADNKIRIAKSFIAGINRREKEWLAIASLFPCSIEQAKTQYPGLDFTAVDAALAAYARIVLQAWRWLGIEKPPRWRDTAIAQSPIHLLRATIKLGYNPLFEG